jgi:hypothetical protein
LFDLATQESLHSSGPESEQLCDTLLNNLRLRPRG